jgi:hypothetical protein
VKILSKSLSVSLNLPQAINITFMKVDFQS